MTRDPKQRPLFRSPCSPLSCNFILFFFFCCAGKKSHSWKLPGEKPSLLSGPHPCLGLSVPVLQAPMLAASSLPDAPLRAGHRLVPC